MLLLEADHKPGRTTVAAPTRVAEDGLVELLGGQEEQWLVVVPTTCGAHTSI